MTDNTKDTSQQKENLIEDTWMELSNISSMVSTGATYGTSADITLDQIYKYMMNPRKHIKQIRTTSEYLTNRHGILKDVVRMVQSLPTLKYNLIWTREDDNQERNEQDEMIVQNFLDEINVKKMLRDGLYETAEAGTVVTCLRNKSYVQFLDLDDVVIRKQRAGKWIVEFDLKTLDDIKDSQAKRNKMDSLPPVVRTAYLKYKKSNDKQKDRFVEIPNCDVISIDSRRNSPYGLPIHLGSWLPILQKELINKVERSVSGRMLSQILVLTADFIDKEKTKPVPKPLLQSYFSEVSKVLQKKEENGVGKTSQQSGSGLVALPHFLSLDSVNMDTTLFKEELYDKLDADIFSSLGVSRSLIYGEGGNYASANVNEIKFFSYITTILEQFESVLNGYLKLILPKGKQCKIILDRTTVLDKDAQIDRFRELYMQTGIASPYIEALFGGDTFHAMLEQAKYEKEVLKTGDILNPPLNAYTSSSKDLKGNSNNENTEGTKDNDGNNNPRPTDD